MNISYFRGLSFTVNFFGGLVPSMNLTSEDYETIALVNREITNYNEAMKKIKYVQYIIYVIYLYIHTH